MTQPNTHTSRWNPKTEEGQRNLEALSRILKDLEHRGDLKDAVENDPVLGRISYTAITFKVHREATMPGSVIGQLWHACPRQPNLLLRLFPDQSGHPQLKADLTTKTLRECREKYPELQGLTKEQRYELKTQLGIRASTLKPKNGTQTWFLELPPRRMEDFKNQFLRDYMDVPLGRTDGITPKRLLELWPEGISQDGFRYAAAHLGESRSRSQIADDKRAVAGLDSSIDNRLEDLIYTGALNDPGPEQLYQQILREFSQDLKTLQHQLTREQFLDRVERLVWTEGSQGVLPALTQHIKSGMGPEKFREYHTYIPLAMIVEKSQYLTGITNILHPISLIPSSARGIQRYAGRTGLQEIGKFKLPRTTYKEPYEVPVNDFRNWKAMVVNGTNIGLLHTPLIAENPARRAFAQADWNREDALFLTNFLDIETRRAAGPSRVLQALVSGVNIDKDVLDPEYAKDAESIIDAVLAEIETGHSPGLVQDSTLVYQTAPEIFANLIKGWRKIAIRPVGKTTTQPEYSGPVRIVIGINEERLIIATAYWEIHYHNVVEQLQIDAEIKTAFSAFHRSEREKTKLAVRRSHIQAEVGNTTDPATREDLTQDLEWATQEIQRISEEGQSLEQNITRLKDLKARSRITNVTREEWQRYYNRALAFFVRTIEDPEVIPNCKVIGKGTTHVKLGERIIQLHIPSHTRVTDTLLTDYAKAYGPTVLRKEMPDIAVICHPYAPGPKLTAREADLEGRRRAVKVCVAPICADTQHIRGELGTIVHRAHPIHKTAFHLQSAPGVLCLRHIDGVTTVNDFPLQSLAAFEHYALKRHRPKAAYNPKYIWIKVATDQHWGAKNKEFVWCKKCRVILGMSDAVFHNLRHAGYNATDNLPPIHVFVANDDVTQGHHFPAENQPDPHELSMVDLEQEITGTFQKIEGARTKDLRDKLADYLQDLLLYQTHIQGRYTLTEQMLLVQHKYLEPNIDMFDGILRRAFQAKLVVKGISEFERAHNPQVRGSSRDLGVINLGTGNHFKKTVNGTLAEGPIYAVFLKGLLLQDPFWKSKRNLIEQGVKGPIYGNEFIGLGTIQALGGYEWGLDFRNTPTGRFTDWGDPLLKMVQNDLTRANYGRMLEGKISLKTVGDKHFLAYTRTDHAYYLMGPPGTHTDLFGELGFPPNNTGIVFIGLPAEGPEAGPILIRALLYDDIRDMVQDNPRNFDWKRFLPAPV